jgi:pyruvate formate lyase activating enzyme
MHAASFYHKAPDGTLQCDLCRHYCRIKPGRTGVCRVRKTIDDRIYALNFGLAVSSASDPVEKKPLYHFMPGSQTWSIGAPGCNFACANCQNWQISQSGSELEGIPNTEPERVVADAIEAGCPSVACTYTEPTIFAEYALEIMKLARSAGLKTIWKSNGYMSPNCLESIGPWLDAINIDLKSMDDAFYRRVCRARVEPVLENLRSIVKSSIHLEVTTLVIPGYSDDIAMLARLAGFIAQELGNTVPWHVTPFYPEISWKMVNTPETSAGMLESAFNIGRNAGLSYIYAGEGHQNTNCPICGQKMIERRRTVHRQTIVRFDVNGRCPNCNAVSSIKE